MTPDALYDLSNDIRANGLQERIKLIRYYGDRYAVIDGRSRRDALDMIGPINVFEGTAPNRRFFEVIDLEGRDPLTFVISMNIHRRHLTAEQKRGLIAEMLRAQPELSDRTIASTTNVSDKTVGAVRRKLEGRAEIPHTDIRADTSGRWQRARKAKPAEPGKGRKHRPRAPETTHDEIESGLPLAPPQVPKSPEPASPPGPSNPPVEAAQPPDPIRDHLANILGAAAALSRVPDDVDFHRMATIVDVSKRLHLRSRVSRAMDVLQGMREALGEAIDGPTLNEQDQSDKVDDLSSLEITEKMPPLPG